MNRLDDLISRQTAIDAIANCTNCGDEKTLRAYVAKHNLDNEWSGGVLEAINAVEDLPSAQPEQRWVPCSERLPEESGRYLVSVLDGVGRRTTVAPYQPRYKAWTMTGRMAYWKVIAWMPLPAQYIPEGDDKHEG